MKTHAQLWIHSFTLSSQFYNWKWKFDFDVPALKLNAFAISAVCRDLDVWRPESNQVISRGYWIFTVNFIEIAEGIYETSW